MIRLDCDNITGGQAVLRVAGRIVGDDVEILAAQLQHWLASCDRVDLNLDAVEHVDATGLQLLHRWHRARLRLRGGSAYLRALLIKDGLQLDDPTR